MFITEHLILFNSRVVSHLEVRSPCALNVHHYSTGMIMSLEVNEWFPLITKSRRIVATLKHHSFGRVANLAWSRGILLPRRFEVNGLAAFNGNLREPEGAAQVDPVD